ncbi:MAG: helix-turn-helix domain-containing protein, partial [Gammaproteobacteria bacterium]
PIAIKISHVADELGVTRQYLSRLSRMHLGLDPKTFCRMLRMQQLLKSLKWDQLQKINWSTTALDYGFYDQSHLINDCKDIVGFTPSSIQYNEFPFFQSSQGHLQ